jgi:hypothetical protein
MAKDKLTGTDPKLSGSSNLAKINQFIEAEEDKVETHFVENPFIKLRERVQAGMRNINKGMTVNDLEDSDEDKQDIIFEKDNKKFNIKDLE